MMILWLMLFGVSLKLVVLVVFVFLCVVRVKKRVNNNINNSKLFQQLIQ